MPRRNNQCYIHSNSEIVNTARVVSAYIIVVAMFAAIGSFLFVCDVAPEFDSVL
jgi:hypothetical protein